MASVPVPPTLDQLRSLRGSTVSLTTPRGPITGAVLSATRRSVWLVSGDDDLVVDCSDIVSVSALPA